MGYSVDTSILITCWNVTHNPENHPTFWTNIDILVANGSLLASEEVLVDLAKQDDEVYAWARERHEMFIPLYAEIQVAVKDILRDYHRLIDTRRNRSSSDPWVIALALVQGLTVVTAEKPTRKLDKPKIPDVCDALGINCVTINELIREQGWRF